MRLKTIFIALVCTLTLNSAPAWSDRDYDDGDDGGNKGAYDYDEPEHDRKGGSDGNAFGSDDGGLGPRGGGGGGGGRFGIGNGGGNGQLGSRLASLATVMIAANQLKQLFGGSAYGGTLMAPVTDLFGNIITPTPTPTPTSTPTPTATPTPTPTVVPTK